MSNVNERLSRLEELALRLSALAGDVSREILEIRAEVSKPATTLDSFIASPAKTVKANVDVHVEVPLDNRTIRHRYVRYVELPTGESTQHVVGLDDKGTPVGVRTTHGADHPEPDVVPLIQATRERLTYVGWTDQSAPRKPGRGGPWKRLS